MTTRTEAAKPQPRKRNGRTILAACPVVLVLGLLVMQQVMVAVLLGVVFIAVGVLVLRARWAKSSARERIAARRRRRHQGPASWAELRRHASRPSGGIPICTVTKGRTR